MDQAEERQQEERREQDERRALRAAKRLNDAASAAGHETL